MTKPISSKPSLIPAFLALLVLILLGYLLVSDFVGPKHTEQTINPPIEIIEEVILVQVDEETVALNPEADIFIEELVKPSPTPININEEEGQFVRLDSLIFLPDLEQRITTIEALLADPHLSDDTLLTLHYTTTQLSETTLAQLGDITEDHIEAITIMTKEGQTITKPLADLLNQFDPNATITLITEIKHSKQLTVGELANSGLSLSDTVMAIIHRGTQELSIKDIIQSSELPDSALFYLHRVSERDQQGLWGIIQAGLIDTFREGLHLEGITLNQDLVQVTIPADADEKIARGFSSFLGKILNNKVDSSYVYNFSTNTMGINSNIILPGQQLIMVHFSPAELKRIYQFFSDKRNQDIETFAISG